MKILSIYPYIFPLITTSFLITFISTTAFSQTHIHIGLPDSAKARFGRGRIHQIKYYPDNKRLAVATSIGVWIYDVQRGEALDLLIGHTGQVKSIAFSPDGGALATGSDDYTIRMWDTSSGEHKATCVAQKYTGRRKDGIQLIAFNPNGEILASNGDRWDIHFWDAHTGKLLKTLSTDASPMLAMAYSTDASMLLTIGNSDKYEFVIEYWNVDTSDHVKDVLIENNYNAVAISPDRKILAVRGDHTPSLQFLDVESGELLKSAEKCNERFESIEFSSDGRNVVTGGFWDSVSLWDVSTAKRLKSVSHGEPINSVTISPDGKTIASGSDDGKIQFWDIETGKLSNHITGHTESKIYSAAFSPDGNILVCGGESEIQWWNLQAGVCIRTVKRPGSNAHSIKFSPNGEIFASAGTSMKARLWDAQTGRFLGGFSQHEKINDYRLEDNVPSVVFSPDGSILATGGTDNQVNLWEIRTGEQYLIGDCLATFTEHSENVTSVAFSPDGKVLASGSKDKTIQIWDMDTRTHLKTFTGHDEGVTDVVFSPDGTTLASGSEDGTIRLWNIDTYSLVLPPIEGAGHITSLDYSPDGGILASGTLVGNAIHIWDAKTGQKLHTFTGHTQRVNDVVISSDGTTLASVSNDGTVLLWDLSNTDFLLKK